MSYTSSCKIGSDYVVFNDYVYKYPLYQGDIYNVPNSSYSIQIITLNYDTYGDPYSIISLLKNGIEIGRNTCYPFVAECNYLHDNNNVCLNHGNWDYSVTPYKVGVSTYYNGYSHLECVTGVCTEVTGAGTNTCNTIGSTTECLSQPTHYIEYDFSHLSSTFTDGIATNISMISNSIQNYVSLLLPVGINYINSTFTNLKFRIYLFVPSTLYSLEIQTLDIWLTLKGIAEIITGMLLFAVSFLVDLTIVGIPLATIMQVAAVGITSYGIYDIYTSGSTSGSKETTPVDKVKIVKDFIDNYIMKNCNEAYPTCAITTPTCDVGEMRAYLSCVNNAYISGCQYAKTIQGLDPSQFCDPLKLKRTEIDTCLANNTCTPQEAKDNSDNNIVKPAITNITNVINTILCPGQTWDSNLQKCVDLPSYCWIPSPFGGCLLSAKTGKTLTYIGGGLLIGYIGYKIFVKK